MSSTMSGKLLRSSSFRLMASCFVLFWGAFCLLLVVLYQLFVGSMWDRVDSQIDEAAIYYQGLAEELTPEEFEEILLDEAEFDPIMNYELIGPEQQESPEGYENSGPEPAIWDGEVIRDFTLEDGNILRISQNVSMVTEVIDALREVLYLCALMTFILALGVSFLLSRRMFAQIESVNNACVDITEGNLSRRIPYDGSGDDFDKLAININSMLDRIQALIQDMQQVTDDIAHDLRTPITRIRSQLELLNLSRSPQPEAVAHVIGEVDRLESILQSLLRISRLESGATVSRQEALDMTSLLRSMEELYRPSIEGQGIRFETQLPEKSVLVKGDSSLWSQAIANLLDNAIKYTSEGGVIELVFKSEQSPVLEIRDTGPGIPHHERENVFKRFYRLEKHRASEGNGLGLSMVQAICQRFGASVELSGVKGLVVVVEFLDLSGHD